MWLTSHHHLPNNITIFVKSRAHGRSQSRLLFAWRVGVAWNISFIWCKFEIWSILYVGWGRPPYKTHWDLIRFNLFIVCKNHLVAKTLDWVIYCPLTYGWNQLTIVTLSLPLLNLKVFDQLVSHFSSIRESSRNASIRWSSNST